MTYRFAIQASNPRTRATFDATAENLSDAIESVFLRETEYALLIWNWICIPLSYKYDLSLMVDDIVDLVEDMVRETMGHRMIHWPSNTFASTWNVKWQDGKVMINATWECVLGKTEGLLAERSMIAAELAQFVGEWR